MEFFLFDSSCLAPLSFAIWFVFFPGRVSSVFSFNKRAVDFDSIRGQLLAFPEIANAELKGLLQCVLHSHDRLVDMQNGGDNVAINTARSVDIFSITAKDWTKVSSRGAVFT